MNKRKKESKKERKKERGTAGKKDEMTRRKNKEARQWTWRAKNKEGRSKKAPGEEQVHADELSVKIWKTWELQGEIGRPNLSAEQQEEIESPDKGPNPGWEPSTSALGQVCFIKDLSAARERETVRPDPSAELLGETKKLGDLIYQQSLPKKTGGSRINAPLQGRSEEVRWVMFSP